MEKNNTLPIKVLIVDDNHHMRLLLKELLRSANIQDIEEASEPIEALELLKTKYVDIILVDHNMPTIDGTEFVKIIRNSSDSNNKFVPIIMVTGYSELSKVMAARDAGVNEFLVKPINAKSLMARIQAVIDKPKPFIKANTYFGPDRRRRNSENFAEHRRRKDD